jgi:hypothetical protein
VTVSDPGYGDPRAPLGSPDWAKRWRLEFQTVVKSLPDSPQACLGFFEVGREHRAWTLLTDKWDKPFPDFDSFCRTRQPWGLGMDPEKFRAYLDAELGKKAADLVTVDPGQQGERTDLNGTSAHREPKSGSASDPKVKRLRAILRAPEVIQDLYRDDRLTQQTAAKLGPKSPTPQKAAKVAEARQRIERLDRSQDKPAFRKQAARVVRDVLGGKADTPLDLLRRAWGKANESERAAFLEWCRAEVRGAKPCPS